MPESPAPGLRVRIHRGAREIGGSCIELECAGRRLVLDLGMPLDGEGELPAVTGLASGDEPGLLGVVLTHSHPDHYGLIDSAAPVPLYMGEATERILAEAAFFTPGGLTAPVAGHLRDRETLCLGPFAITPHLVDHSAFDAHALLVEAGGRRLFYTGDLRAHGRKPGTFARLLGAPRPVDVLLMEGTHVRSGPPPHAALASEKEVEDRAAELFRATPGMALALYLPQNVDRMVTLFRAAKRSGRLFVHDLYAASIACATGRPKTIPQPDWPEVRVYVPHAQRGRVIRSGEFARVRGLRDHRLFPEQLGAMAGRLVMIFRPSMARELERSACLEGAHALWSQWSGYLEGDPGRELRAWLDGQGIPLTELHTSGHATVADLQRLARALAPARVVPVHTAAPARFHELFDHVDLHADGEWWRV